MCEETGSLIGVSGRPAFFWHEEPAELGEFVSLSAALDFVVAHDAYLLAGRSERDGVTRFQANHAEAEAATMDGPGWCTVGQCDGFVVFVESDDGVVDHSGQSPELFQGHVRLDIEEFPGAPDTKVGEVVNHSVYHAFRLVILHCAQGGVDLEWKRDGGVVEFLGAYVDGAGAFPDLDPILTETGVCQDIDVYGFFVWLFLFSGHMFFRNWAVAGMRNRYARMFISANIRLFADSLRNKWPNLGTCEDVIHAGPAP